MAAEHDVDLLVRESFFPGRVKGVIVEVGAARPDFLSISESFRAIGWRVVAVEPNPEFCELHRRRGQVVLQYAASDHEADDVAFFIVSQKDKPEYFGGNVSFESFSSLGIRGPHVEAFETVRDRTEVATIPVKVRKLDTILRLHEPDLTAIDILAIDVEGWELNVMRGLSAARYNPKVVILESIDDDPAYVSFMHDLGYVRWRRLTPNDVYIRPGNLRLAARYWPLKIGLMVTRSREAQTNFA